MKNPAGCAGGVWGKLSAAYPIRDGACATTPTTMTRTTTGATARAANRRAFDVAGIRRAEIGKTMEERLSPISREKTTLE